MTAEAADIHQLVVGLFVVIGIIGLEVAAIASYKIEREQREAIEAKTKEAIVGRVIEALDRDEPLIIPLPRGLRGRATRETLIAMIATIRGEARTRLVGALEERGYVERTVRLLRSRRAATRARGCMILGGMLSERANAPLLDRFRNDPDQNVRLTAAEALAEIGNALTSADLIEAVKHSSNWQRLRVANVISRMGETAVPALLDSLADEDEAILRLALDILCDIAHVPEFMPVLRLLAHPSAEIRGRAVDLLGIAGDIDAIDQVMERAADAVWFVRVRAIKSMERLGVPMSDEVADRYYARLATLLSDEKWWVRQRAAQALANAGSLGYQVLQASVSDAAVSALQMHDIREARA